MKKGTEGAMQIDRRHFLKGSVAAAALAGAGALAGCAPKAQDGSQSQQEKAGGESAMAETGSAAGLPGPEFEMWMPPQGEVCFVADPISDIASTEECDVVVVGMGATGMPAAAFAAGAGLKTVVVEKLPSYSANPGDLHIINSSLHREASFVSETRNELISQLMITSGYRANARKIGSYYDYSAEAFDWFYENVVLPQGAKGIVEFTRFGTNMKEGWNDCLSSTIKWDLSGADASSIHDVFARYVTENCDVRYETPAAQLVCDESGAVVGVIVRTSEGGYSQINARKGVILATGGYAQNMERMKKYMRPRDYSTFAAAMCPTTGCTGDGHEMGLAVGAAEDEAPHGMATDNMGLAWSNRLEYSLSFPFVRVNDKGRRYVNEEGSFNFTVSATVAQPKGRCWVVFDAGVEEQQAQFIERCAFFNENVPAGSPRAYFDELVEAGEGVRADTVAELAALMEVDADALQKTFEDFTAFARDGEDKEFGRDILFPLDTPPFYAFREGPTLLNTCSGLKTDEMARVVTVDEDVIPGLYAVGDCAGGFFSGTLYPHQCYGVDWGSGFTMGYCAVQAILGQA